MNFVQVLQACEQASGSGSKKVIMDALATADPDAKILIREALDTYRVFGVKKYTRPEKYAKKDPKDHYELLGLLDKLDDRDLTGNAARDEVTRVLSLYTETTSRYIERILDKDLKAGFSADTVNKVFPKWIPKFEVMLAEKCESVEDFEKKISFPCQADFKYDGERNIAIVRKNSVTYYSRSGKEATHVNGIFDDELLLIRQSLGYDYVLDGERYARNFIETVNAKKEGDSEAKNNLRLLAFFLMPLNAWMKQKCTITMKENRKFLSDLLKKLKLKKIVLSQGRQVDSYEDMMGYCNEVIDKHGVEGLVLKDWNSPYIWDRDMAWCKVKKFYDVDCRIVGFYPGKPKSRLANTLGGISVVGFLEDGTRVEANVGSGFSDELRQEIFENQDTWMGRTVVVKYQEISHSKDRKTASLRFLTYLRWRDDKIISLDV